jgi:hypothetical protein
MKDYFSTQDTIHQLSCVKTSQQNAIVERKHQHLLNVARALRLLSHLPLTFWADCILITAHIINIILTPCFLSNKSPHELLYSVIPSYSHLKVFGCLAYVSTLSRNRTKFDSRATPCVFIGCSYGTEGFKFFSFHNHFVIISRHAIFHETIFSYASHLDHSSSPIHENIPLLIPSPIPDTSKFCYVQTESMSSSIPQSKPAISPNPNTPSYSNSSSKPMNSSSTQSPCPPFRKSSRVKTYLQDFHCQLVSSSPPPSTTMPTNSSKSYPLSSFVS